MSADGRRIVGTVLEVRQSLERVPVVFDRPVQLEPLTDGFFGDVDPAWSPDGLRLAAASVPGAFSASIWIIELQGAKPFRKLLDLPSGALPRGLTWSSDGSTLMLGRIRRTGDNFLAERSASR